MENIQTVEQFRGYFPEITDEAIAERIAAKQVAEAQAAEAAAAAEARAAAIVESERAVQSLRDQLAAAEARHAEFAAQG